MVYQTSAIELLLSLGALNSSHYNLTELCFYELSFMNPAYIHFEYSQDPDFADGGTER